MTPEVISEATRQLVMAYGEDVCVSVDDLRTLARITSVELYPTCRPAETDMLLVLDPGQPKPIAHVLPGQLLANGRAPKNSSVVLVGGESWMQFSFNIPWAEGDGIIRFVAAARQRFSQNE